MRRRIIIAIAICISLVAVTVTYVYLLKTFEKGSKAEGLAERVRLYLLPVYVHRHPLVEDSVLNALGVCVYKSLGSEKALRLYYEYYKSFEPPSKLPNMIHAAESLGLTREFVRGCLSPIEIINYTCLDNICLTLTNLGLCALQRNTTCIEHIVTEMSKNEYFNVLESYQMSWYEIARMLDVQDLGTPHTIIVFNDGTVYSVVGLVEERQLVKIVERDEAEIKRMIERYGESIRMRRLDSVNLTRLLNIIRDQSVPLNPDVRSDVTVLMIVSPTCPFCREEFLQVCRALVEKTKH